MQPNFVHAREYRAKALKMAAAWGDRIPNNEEFAEFRATLQKVSQKLGREVSSRAELEQLDISAVEAEFMGSFDVSGLGKGNGHSLVDQHGNITRAIGKGESFAQAFAKIGGRGGAAEFREGEKLVQDGLTLGNLIKARLIGPTNSVEKAALSGAGTGGYTVPEILAADFIDLFRPKSQMFRASATIVPLDGSDSFRFAKLTGDPTPAWRNELADIDESEPTFGAINLTPKSLAVIVRVSRELLQDSKMIGRAIERAMTEAFAKEIDRVGMFGVGAGAEPLGVVNTPGINEIPTAGAIANYSEVLDAYKLLLDDNAPDPTAVIMSNREWRTYAGLADTTNQPLQRPKAIENLPFLATSAVPTNGGGGGNESTAVIGHFPDFVYGMRAELQIDLLRELYAKSHEFGFVAHLRMDTGCFHPESFCKITGITPT